MRIALAQIHNTPDMEANRHAARELLARARDESADLIVFPEMSVLQFFPRTPHRYEFFHLAEPVPGPTMTWFQEQARTFGLHIVYNHYERSLQGLHFDASYVIDRDGRYRGRQRMMHLAEEPGFNEKFYYTPGWDDYRVFNLDDWTFGIAICYDRHFPEVFRSFVLQGAELVLVPTAVSRNEAFARVYELEMQAAAVANGVYIAMANRAGPEPPLEFMGHSLVVDPYGSVVAALDDAPHQVLVVSLHKEQVYEARIQFPFLRDRRPETYGRLVRNPPIPE